jgi:hypothetical protein
MSAPRLSKTSRVLSPRRLPLVSAAALLLASTVLAVPALCQPQPTKDALSLAELVRARQLGVDHLGNLWGWNGVEGSVRFFSPTAARLGTLLIPKDAMAADGDLEWGAVALDKDGAHLVWARPRKDSDAGPAALPAAADAIDLPEIASWVCWIDADRVAVAPQRAGHRVEIWSLRHHKMLASIGKETKIVLKNGANRVREVQLHYDTARGLLYTLESFTGDLAVFKLDGTLVWHRVVDNPWRKLEEAKLAALDAKAKVHDTAYPQMFSDLWLAEGPDGSAWVRQDLDTGKRLIMLSQVTADAVVPKTVDNVRCPTKTFTIWGDHLVFFRDIALPRVVCNSVAAIP